MIDLKEAGRQLHLNDPSLSWNKLEPKHKVQAAVSMTNVVTQICADGVRETNPTITDDELIPLLRRRFQFGRRSPEEE